MVSRAFIWFPSINSTFFSLSPIQVFPCDFTSLLIFFLQDLAQVSWLKHHLYTDDSTLGHSLKPQDTPPSSSSFLGHFYVCPSSPYTCPTSPMSYSGHAGQSSGSSACHVICWPSTVLQVSHLSYHLWSGLLLCISSWSSGTALPVSQLPSSLLCLWLCYAFLPFQDRTSNFLLLTSIISLSSSFNTSFYFCSQAQWFSSYFPDQHHHHLLETG